MSRVSVQRLTPQGARRFKRWGDESPQLRSSGPRLPIHRRGNGLDQRRATREKVVLIEQLRERCFELLSIRKSGEVPGNLGREEAGPIAPDNIIFDWFGEAFSPYLHPPASLTHDPSGSGPESGGRHAPSSTPRFDSRGRFGGRSWSARGGMRGTASSDHSRRPAGTPGHDTIHRIHSPQNPVHSPRQIPQRNTVPQARAEQPRRRTIWF